MARFVWFRFWCEAHGKGKIRALSDSEFRLLTRVWGLARESQKPGWVYVVPGVGWDASELAQSAGCKSGKPEAMLRRLAELSCIAVHAGGVIEVHDWEAHNPASSPPSKQPEARRQQKRKERSGQGVARVSPGDRVATEQGVARRQGGDGEACRHNVATIEGEGEGDTEREASLRDAARAAEAGAMPPPGAPPAACSPVERLRVDVSAGMGFIGAGGAGYPPISGRRLGEAIRDAVEAVRLLGYETVLEALLVDGRAARDRGEPPETFGFFVRTLHGLAHPAPPQQTNGRHVQRASVPRASDSEPSEWWRFLTHSEATKLFRRRHELAPELDDAPVTASQVERDGGWVELPELVQLLAEYRSVVAARLHGAASQAAGGAT